MFRRRPPSPARPLDDAGIRFLDEATSPRPQPQPQVQAQAQGCRWGRRQAQAQAAPAAVAVPVAVKPQAAPAPAKKPRSFPIGTLAFLAVVVGGMLFVDPADLGFQGNAEAEEKLTRSFAVEPATPVIVETFNGSITVEQGPPEKVECEVVKHAKGADDAKARDELRTVSVTMGSLGDAVRVTARRLSSLPNHGSGATIRLRVPEGTPVVLNTSNGPIRVDGVGAQVEAHASNGRIEIDGAVGVLDLNASNGGIRCDAQDAILKVETSNGEVEFRGTLAPGHGSIHTSNGAVTLRLPEETAFRVDAKATNGKVESDFDLDRQRTSSRSRHLVGYHGDEPAVDLKVRTSNGTIRLVEDDD